MQHGGDFADIFIEKKATTFISCEENHIERIKSGTDIGAGIRVVYDDMTSYAYTNELDKDKLIEIADIASRAVKRGNSPVTLDFKQIAPDFCNEVELFPGQVKTEDKVEVVEQANTAARKTGGQIAQVAVTYADAVQDVVIANSLGRYVQDKRVRTRLSVTAIANGGNMIQTGFDSNGGACGFELFKRVSPWEMGQKAATRALTMLQAKPAPAGNMPVVMAGEAGGTMVHEACGHGLEADLVQKGLSVYAGKQGQQVAADTVTVIDDGTIPGKFGTMVFDDEGFPTQKTVLIENGVLQGYMYDYLTARRDDTCSTGNGRRESFEDKPIPRMRNTYIAPGKDGPDLIVKAVKDGLLVKKMGGGQVNTVNGDFMFEVAEGYRICNGKIAYPVKGATLTGNGPQALKNIDMVGSDFGFTIGVCGKNGQGAPVSDAQPTIRIPELIVGGTEYQGGNDPKICRR